MSGQPSVSWRTKTANFIIQLMPKGLRTRTSNVQGQEKMDISAQEDKENSLIFHLLIQFRPSVDWRVLTTLVELLSVLSLLPQMLIFFRNTFTSTSRNNVLLAIWTSLHSGK